MIFGNRPNRPILLEVHLLSRIGAALGSVPGSTRIIVTVSQCLAANGLDALLGQHVE